MSKTPVNMRLDVGLLERVDAYAASRLSNRTAVVQAALEAFLADVEGGVPVLPEVAEERPQAPKQRSVAQAVERRMLRRELPPAKDPRLSQEPQRGWFKTYAGFDRAMARFREKGEW